MNPFFQIHSIQLLWDFKFVLNDEGPYFSPKFMWDSHSPKLFKKKASTIFRFPITIILFHLISKIIVKFVLILVFQFHWLSICPTMSKIANPSSSASLPVFLGLLVIFILFTILIFLWTMILIVPMFSKIRGTGRVRPTRLRRLQTSLDQWACRETAHHLSIL